MIASDLRTAIRDLGLTPAEFAKVVGRSWRHVERWISDAPDPRTGKPTPIPDYVWLYIERERARQLNEGERVMAEIAALAKRKVELQARLMAISMMNVYGQSIDKLQEIELDKIETRKELESVEREVEKYINQCSEGGI